MPWAQSSAWPTLALPARSPPWSCVDRQGPVGSYTLVRARIRVTDMWGHRAAAKAHSRAPSSSKHARKSAELKQPARGMRRGMVAILAALGLVARVLPCTHICVCVCQSTLRQGPSSNAITAIREQRGEREPRVPAQALYCGASVTHPDRAVKRHCGSKQCRVASSQSRVAAGSSPTRVLPRVWTWTLTPLAPVLNPP